MKDNNGSSRKSSGASSIMKRFGIGLAGGVLGGFLVLGGYTLMDGNNPNSTTNNTGSTNSGSANVSNVSVNTSSDITKAVDKVKDAVVSVTNLQTASTGTDIFGFPSESQSGEEGELQDASEGSGVIYKVDGDSAYIVTNNHVVADAKGLRIQLADGTTKDAELVGSDAYTDLAVLKIDSEGVETSAEFGDSDALTVGEPAIAIGSPLGSQFANSVTSGIVSSLNREVTIQNTDGEQVTSYAIQTDAAINPGNSGGPLVNIEGQIIGINSSKIASSGGTVEGMGFAIPSNQVVKIIDQLVKDGEVVRPALGVTMRDLASISTQQREQYFKGLPEELTGGAIIASVTKDAPAEKAGLERYDVVTEIDGKEITSSADLKSTLYEKNVGDKIEIKYYRDGKENKTTVDLTMKSSDLSSTPQNNQNNQVEDPTE